MTTRAELLDLDPAQRSRLYRAFVAKWSHPEYPPEPEPEAILVEVEGQLGFALPGAYRQFMREIGPVVSTGALRETIAASGLDARDLSEFHAARDVGRATLAWRRSNLPADFVTFASDGSGNQFCLRTSTAETPADDASIWVWYHETDTAEPVAPSFTAWLSALLEIERRARDEA